MRIKKDPNTRNEFIRAGDFWVRNFTKTDSQYKSADCLVKREDYAALIRNESLNHTLGLPNIAYEKFSAPNVVIVSDGYGFAERHRCLSRMPGVVVLAVNRALAKWSLADTTLPQAERKSINAYVVNNPFPECMAYLPRNTKYYPICVASSRTHTEFIKNYKGNVFIYEPTPDGTFGYGKSVPYYLDDYRNSICAAISLAYRLGVRNLLLMCCDDAFGEERPGAIRLENGLWSYPHQYLVHELIEANLYWLTRMDGVRVADYSNGSKYINAAYIDNEEEALAFFNPKRE